MIVKEKTCIKKTMMLKIRVICILFVLSIVEGCDIFHGRENEPENILIHASYLEDKYKHEKLASFLETQDTSHSATQTYANGLVFGKTFNVKYSDYINTDVFSDFQTVLYDNELCVMLRNGNAWSPKSILLKINDNKYDVVVVMANDYEAPFIFTPSICKLKTSINRFHIGDTIIGEIELSYADSLHGYECNGFFISIVTRKTEEWRMRNFQLPSGDVFDTPARNALQIMPCK